ncbi:hypothetical protein FFLO_07149 [Filobasidium floriforme]|uniref:Uncharacterized protein n=1 Tax=Filobasidium floriforme TaxID=5210 RepID=A0A8K0JDG5_9TREE|nr:uncharacterized protein HD553DRAFT_322435 [Filobasidium floriforme]KAG7527224.1 hypothetical protein FFLO_07149 [Filobasidium floriforme]KAH8088597.1 hypothetical protein HD553DRAFT_322435 [Filobasidium floriforme]
MSNAEAGSSQAAVHPRKQSLRMQTGGKKPMAPLAPKTTKRKAPVSSSGSSSSSSGSSSSSSSSSSYKSSRRLSEEEDELEDEDEDDNEIPAEHLTGISVVDDDHEDEWAQLRAYMIEKTVGDRVIGYREPKALARLKKLWQAREYWTDQRLYELCLKKRGSVNGKGPDHFEAGILTLFARQGKVRKGEDRCGHCRAMWTNPKRKGNNGEFGLLVQCKQTAPNKNCAQCSFDGVVCDKRVNTGGLVKVQSGGWDLAIGCEGVAEQVQELMDGHVESLDPEDEEDVVALNRDDLHAIRDKTAALVRALGALKDLCEEIPDRYYSDDKRQAQDSNNRVVKLWEIAEPKNGNKKVKK